MNSSGHFFPRAVTISLVVGPFAIMGILCVTVLWPTIKDPESNMYTSSIGYPALKRLIGQPIKVQTVPVAVKPLEESVAAPGESVGLQAVDVKSLVSGKVDKVYIKEGQWVRKGQPLLEIEQAPLRDKVASSRNDLAIAQKNLQNLPQLNQEHLVELKANVESPRKKLVLNKNDLQAKLQSHQEHLVELEYNVENAKEQLTIAQERLNLYLSLESSGAVGKSSVLEAKATYATRQKELISAQQQLAQARIDITTNLDETRKDYADNKNDLVSAEQELLRNQISTRQDLETSRLNVENSEITLRQAIRDLNNTVIVASTDGLISRVNIYKGEVADLQTSVITITKDVVFKAYIDQASLNAVKVDEPARVRLVAYPGKTFLGKVIQINPTVQTNAPPPTQIGINQQYTYSVWIEIQDLKMPPGLQGYTQFSHNSKTSLVIPESAVTHLSAGEGLVMVAEQGKAIVKRVKLGRILSKQREVIQGLTQGEQVVLYPRAINPGDPLKILGKPEQKPQAKSPSESVNTGVN